MEPHQQRVIAEKADLDEKIAKLGAFLGTELFRGVDPGEQDRLRTQLAVMGVYAGILEQRIAAF